MDMQGYTNSAKENSYPSHSHHNATLNYFRLMII